MTIICSQSRDHLNHSVADMVGVMDLCDFRDIHCGHSYDIDWTSGRNIPRPLPCYCESKLRSMGKLLAHHQP